MELQGCFLVSWKQPTEGQVSGPNVVKASHCESPQVKGDGVQKKEEAQYWTVISESGLDLRKPVAGDLRRS